MSTKQNTTNTATAPAESTAIAIKADFTPIEYKSKSAALNDSIARYNSIAASVASAIGNTKSIIAEAKKQSASIFYGWKQTKLYEADGYKSFSEMVNAMGLNTAAVLAAVRYAEANHSHADAFASLTVDNYAAINSAVKADSAKVIADAKSGKLDAMTQTQLKEYAAKVIADAPTTKSGKVLTMYRATTADGKEIDTPRPLADWKVYWNADEYLLQLLNSIKLDDGVVYAIVPLDFSHAPFLMFCRKESKPAESTKPADFRAAAIARLAERDGNVAGVNAGLAMFGFEPLTPVEIDKYSLMA